VRSCLLLVEQILRDVTDLLDLQCVHTINRVAAFTGFSYHPQFQKNPADLGPMYVVPLPTSFVLDSIQPC